MRRNAGQRTAAALLALLAQALLLVLFMQPGAPERPPEPIDAHLIVMQWLRLVPAAAPPVPDQRAMQRQRRSAPLRAAETPTPIPPEPGSAINAPPVAAPRVDWTRQLQVAAARQAQLEADRAQNGVPLDSKPTVLTLPARSADNPKTPQVTLMANGDVEIQYEKVICTHVRPSLAEHFDVWAQHRPAKCRKRGRAPRMTLDAEALQPDSLRQPLPLPPETR